MNVSKYKIITVGNTNVGKTSISTLLEDTNNNIDICHPTIGANLFSINFKCNDIKYNIQLWDTAGHEKFRSLLPLYTRHSDIVLFVFDITNEQSLKDIYDYWHPKVLKDLGESAIYYLICNKTDLYFDDYICPRDITLFKRYFQISAKTKLGIKELLESIKKDISSVHTKFNNDIKNNINETYSCCY